MAPLVLNMAQQYRAREVRLRPDSKPKEFDWTLINGNHEFGGIYELTENQFRFGVRATNNEAGRPTEIVRDPKNAECYEMERIVE